MQNFAGSGVPGFDLRLTTVPEIVYTVAEGPQVDAAADPREPYAAKDDLTWMFHLVFESDAPIPLRIEEVEVLLTRDGVPQYREVYHRSYLERMEWVRGRYELTPRYFLDNVFFGKEERVGPDVPIGGTISWVRIPLAQPWFAPADRAELHFRVSEPGGTCATVAHEVALARHAQEVKLRLPFAGRSLVVKGNELGPITHRWTGLNGLTTFGWDFAKLPDDAPAAAAPAVLAVADGRVAHIRNDIDVDVPDATRQQLEEDGDLLAGNLVVLDHGRGEFTLTSHLAPGSVTVRIGDQVTAGQELGRVGKLGMVHVNLMDAGAWLNATGLPASFSDFERVLPVGPPERIALGNPLTGWVVVPARESGP